MPTKRPVVIEIEQKTFPFEVKSIDEDQGIIKGYLSVFNNIDSQKDRVRPNAFKKTIQDAIQRKDSRGKKYLWPLLFMHDPEKPIGGFIDAIEDKYGLLVTAQLDISTNDHGIPNNPLATSVFSGFKLGYVDELSIGYKAIQKSYEAGTGIRDLTEIQNYEGSAVVLGFASNPEAIVTDVKRLRRKYNENHDAGGRFGSGSGDSGGSGGGGGGATDPTNTLQKDDLAHISGSGAINGTNEHTVSTTMTDGENSQDLKFTDTFTTGDCQTMLNSDHAYVFSGSSSVLDDTATEINDHPDSLTTMSDSGKLVLFSNNELDDEQLSTITENVGASIDHYELFDTGQYDATQSFNPGDFAEGKLRNTSMQTKAGSFPLADKTTPWSKSKAIKDIETATGGDWSKASKYFFWSAPNPTTEADHKFPFVANVGGTMKAVPRAIFNAAARLSGAKGVDTASVQAAMEPYYAKMGMSAPWKVASTDKEKSSMPDQIQYKDFNDRYREERIKDWKSTDFQNLVVALQSAIMDIFAIGDEPQMDILDTILNGANEGGESGNKIGFVDALKDYVQKGIDLDVSNYMDDNPYWGSVYSSSYGYMSRNDKIEGKAGAVVSQSNADRLKGHVDSLMQAKDTISTVADDITHYITGNPAYDDNKQAKPNQEPSKAHEPRQALKSNQPPESTDDFLTMLNSFLATQIPQKAA